MDCYLFSRRDWPELATFDPVAMAGSVFFQMWRVRATPYNRIADGDVVYIGDPATRIVSWEVRVTDLLSDFGYRSTNHALAALRAAYGLYATDLNDYHRLRSGSGWLFAWAPTVMRQVDIRLPAGVRFGQNGYRLLTDQDRKAAGLPKPKTCRPLASPPPWYDPAAAHTGDRRTIPRYIPGHIRQGVAQRDGRRCVGCGTIENLHIDHIVPHSHGGRSTLDNLRVVCARSNLVKGAKGPDVVLTCAA